MLRKLPWPDPTGILPRTVWLLILLWPIVAWAHIKAGEAGGLVSGLSHPVSAQRKIQRAFRHGCRSEMQQETAEVFPLGMLIISLPRLVVRMYD